MHDQITAIGKLPAGGCKGELTEGMAAMFTQDTEKEEVQRIVKSLDTPDGSVRLLYVSPEKLARSKRLMNKLEKCYAGGRLKLIAVDEVHCCSQWGHDWRKDYQFMSVLRRQFPASPVLGLTATAPPDVIEDVKKMLKIEEAVVLRAPLNRPNLFYSVQRKPAAQRQCDAFLVDLCKTRFPGQSGIVYTLTRKEAELVADALRAGGVNAAGYHAEMSAGRRRRVHNQWTSGQVHVIVATVAFGMGIDKPNVRFVIHHSMPKSIENYYQESGRAGRDGQRAECILLFCMADLFRQSTMVCTERMGPEKLYNMLAYCLNSRGLCRRTLIETTFPALVHLRNWPLGVLESCKERITGNKLAEKLVSSLAKNGKSKETARIHAETIIGNLLLDNLLKEDYHFTPYNIISYVLPGPMADTIQTEKEKVGTAPKRIKLQVVE